MTPRRCGIQSKPQSLMQKTHLFYISGTLYAHTRLGLRAYASWLPVQADSYLQRLRASLTLLFQKQIYLLIKIYIFHFNISQVNLTFDWALNHLRSQNFSIIGEWGLESYKVQNAVSTMLLTTFYISHESGVKNFILQFINNCPNGIH